MNLTIQVLSLPKLLQTKSAAFTIIVIALFATSCKNDAVFQKYYNIPNHTWAKDKPAVFQVNISDTLSLNTIRLSFRHGSKGYPFSNLYVFFTTYFPDKTVAKDTLQFIFFDKTGNPLGNCGGDVCNNWSIIAKNVKFPMPGQYKFVISHAMRTENGNLPMVFDVGLTILNSKTKE